MSETLEALVPELVSKTRFADDPVLFAATLIAPFTVMRLLVTNERPEPLARLMAPSARMPLLAPAAVLFAVTERFEPAPVSVIAPRLAMVVAVAPAALIVMPVLAEIAPDNETGMAVEFVVLLIETAPRADVSAPVPETPNWELAVCDELFVMVTPVAPEILAPMVTPATPAAVVLLLFVRMILFAAAKAAPTRIPIPEAVSLELVRKIEPVTAVKAEETSMTPTVVDAAIPVATLAPVSERFP